MGRNLTADSPIFFVCGTPSDRHGFEYKALDGRHLPDQAAKYLDVIPKEKFPERGEATHILRRIKTGELGTAIYAECRWIHPNDIEHNRGAYVAVGCWIEAPLTPTQAMEALHRIEGVHVDLAAHRNQDTETFLPDFQLHAYTAPRPAETNRHQLADLLYQAGAGIGLWDGKAGRLIQTSEEIRQGSLARLCILNRTMDQAPPQPARPDNQDWQTRLHDVMQEAINEAPQTRQALRKLSHLEEQRIKIVKTLIRTVNEAPRRPGTRNGRSSSRYDGAMGGTRWKLTLREIAFSVAGIIFGIAIALAVVGTVELLSEEDSLSSRPTFETEVTPSTSD